MMKRAAILVLSSVFLVLSQLWSGEGRNPARPGTPYFLLLLLQRVERLCRLQSVKIWPARTKGRPSPSRELDYGRATVPRLVLLDSECSPNRMLSGRVCLGPQWGLLLVPFLRRYRDISRSRPRLFMRPHPPAARPNSCRETTRPFRSSVAWKGGAGQEGRRTSFSSHPSRAANSDLLIRSLEEPGRGRPWRRSTRARGPVTDCLP